MEPPEIATRPATRYTRKRADMALDGYRTAGSNVQAAKAAGVCEATLRNWRRDHPEFEAEVRKAIDENAERQGHLAVSAIHKHLSGYVEGATELVIIEDEEVLKDGTRVPTRRIEKRPVTLNPTVLTRALTRYDPRYTHPKQEVEHSGQLTVEQSVAEAAAKLEAGDGTP